MSWEMKRIEIPKIDVRSKKQRVDVFLSDELFGYAIRDRHGWTVYQVYADGHFKCKTLPTRKEAVEYIRDLIY